VRTSHNLGGIPGLSWLWDGSPIRAALTVLIADFGIMSALMLLEGLPPWHRTQYVTVLWNDTLFYPLYAAMVVVVLHTAAPLEGFFVSRRWNVGVLVAGFTISLAQEVIGVAIGQYSMGQEWSPAKLWHTFIAGIVFYWLFTPLVPVFTVRRPKWTMVVVVACIIGALIAIVVELCSPVPRNAHLEGTYIPWEWHERTR